MMSDGTLLSKAVKDSMHDHGELLLESPMIFQYCLILCAVSSSMMTYDGHKTDEGLVRVP